MAIYPKNERGVALILTITLIGLIVILTLQFSKSIRAGLYETANFDDDVRLGAIAKSGFNCALAVLYEDDADVDSLRDDWAELKTYSSQSAAMFDDGAFDTDVTDLSGKIQINKLIYTSGEKKGEFNPDQKGILTRLLENKPFNLKDDQIEGILDAIKDWIDEDDEVTGFGGAEDSYYQSLDKPYSCRNAPLESPDELLLIKGITPEFYYGTSDIPGISNYLTTVQGDGRINFNTASAVVLEALSENLDSTMVEEIVDYRNDEKNDLSKSDWYKSALGTGEDYIDSRLITIKSSFFEIISKGVRDSRTKGITGVVKRNGKKLTVLSWKFS